jgi:hypothetical protein
MTSVVSQFHPRISFYEAAGMLKDGGNLLTLDPKAVADGQIRKLLESNFRPVVNPMHELMTSQFINMMNHRDQQGELQRLATMNSIGLAPVREAVSGILNDPRANPSAAQHLFDLGVDGLTFWYNLRKFNRGEEMRPLAADERQAAVEDAKRAAEAKLKAVKEEMRQKAADSG